MEPEPTVHLVDSRTAGKDLRLLRAATKWNVPEHLRKLVLQEMGLILAGKERDGTKRLSTDRDKIGAAKVVVAADSVDAKAEASDKKLETASVNVNVQTVVTGPENVFTRIQSYRNLLAKSDQSGQGSHSLRNSDGQPLGGPETIRERQAT